MVLKMPMLGTARMPSLGVDSLLGAGFPLSMSREQSQDMHAFPFLPSFPHVVGDICFSIPLKNLKPVKP